jgi:hypothetical protein
VSPADARRVLARVEIERDWDNVRAHLDRSRSVDPRVGAPEAALVALSLDHAYQAFETMLVRIERTLALPERVGAEWHRSILLDATMSLAELRPSIVPAAVERDWDELRRFRHFLRHAYPLELDAERLAQNVQRLERAVSETEALVRKLMEALS